MRNPMLSLISLLVLVKVVSTDVAGKHAVAIRGQLMCGGVPAENVKVRLFRVKQQKKDDICSLLFGTSVGVLLMTHLFTGNPGVFSYEDGCLIDDKMYAKNGYRKFNYNIPAEYVAMGAKPKKTYDFGTLNIQVITLLNTFSACDREYGIVLNFGCHI
ncbi:unnamed protein product [Strongylus vulgaris]|uniref:Transthyretin-like family protein n=1 Tax=Strongylus vulgaris TaxID=40348 RepID=A0A3P7JXZ9_STRVU|nr:unnamed protein product [Strongylus vulgaris]